MNEETRTVEQDVERFRMVAGLGVAASKLVARLKEGRVGEGLTDEELTRVAGKDTRVGGAGYGALMTAIRRCVAEGYVWKRLRGADCIKCLDGPEILEFGETTRKAIHRASKRMTKRLGTIERDSLDEAQRRQFDTQFATQSALAVCSSTTTRKRLEVRTVKPNVDPKALIEFMCSGTMETHPTNERNEHGTRTD